jgi:energy-coupling factor transport system permease protein
MTAAPITGGIATDPYLAGEPAPSWRYLHHLNPLAKLAAPILPIIALLFVRDIATPAALIVLTYLILLTGQRLSRGLVLLLLLAPLAIALLAVGLALWTDPGTLESVGEPVVSIGSWHLYSGALVAGLASSLRLSAMLILALICGAATTGPDLVRSAVQHLHLPYRIGYTALAAYRFIPRFRHELGVIRAAHRVRGRNAGGGPVAAFVRGWGYVLPLMAGAIRHAERVALAMDSRAFGAHPTRTERHLVPWHPRDTAFLIVFTLACAAIFVAGALV